MPFIGLEQLCLCLQSSVVCFPQSQAQVLVTLPQEVECQLHLLQLVSEGGNDSVVEVNQGSILLGAVLLHLHRGEREREREGRWQILLL